jgi:hypothetical protein
LVSAAQGIEPPACLLCPHASIPHPSFIFQEERAKLHIEFTAEGSYSVRVTSTEGEDITSTMQHLPPLSGSYSVEAEKISIEGDQSDLDWTFENEDEDGLRIR